MTQRGAILLEILIAGAIASMLSIVLLTAWMQMNRVQKQIDRMIDQTTRLQTIHNQMHKDLTSLAAPVIKPIKKAKEPSKAPTENAKDGKKTPNKADAPTPPEEPSPEKPDESDAPKQPLSYFASEFDKGMTRRLSFISHNALHWYREGERAIATPSLVRVVYSIKEDPARKGSFNLFRQESTDLYDAPKGGKPSNAAYLLVDGVKSFVMKYEYQKKEEKEQKNEKKSEPELQATDQWPLAKDDKSAPIIPLRVQVVVELWDDQRTKSHTFTLVFPLPVAIESTAQEKVKPAVDEKKSDTLSKPQTPAVPYAPSKPLALLGRKKEGATA